MRKSWIACSVIAAVFILMAGMWLGVHAESNRNQKQQEMSGSIQTTIAVVNQDMGAMNHGFKENYSAAVIDKLGQEYVLVSSQAAQTGYANGTYGAIITFPPNLSAHVVSINEPKPEKVNLEFMVNPKMPEKEYIETYGKMIDLQYEVNQMISYMYVYSIYEEMHDAQSKVTELFKNDEDDMTALGKVKLYNFTENLNLGDVPNPLFEPSRVPFDSFVNQVNHYAEYMAKEYLTSYETASRDYVKFEECLVSLVDVIGTEASAWQTDLEDWKSESESRIKEVQNYKDELLEWLRTAKVWRQNNENWQVSLADYQDKANLYYGKVSGFLDEANSWRKSAQNWGSNIYSQQKVREQAVQSIAEQYNANYEALNAYQESLQKWEKDLQDYTDHLKEEETQVPPETEETTTEAGGGQGNTDDETTTLPPDESVTGVGNEEVTTGAIPPVTTTISTRVAYAKGHNSNSSVSDGKKDETKLEVPGLQLPNGFAMPEILDKFDLVAWEDIACPDIEKVSPFTATLEAPPLGGNDVVMNGLPYYEGETVLNQTPQVPGELTDALSEIEQNTPVFNPGNYLTDEVKQRADNYVTQYAYHLQTVENNLNSNQESNIAKLNQAYFAYNQYVAELRGSALTCHSAEQRRLQDGLGIFYNAKTTTSKENRSLLGFFASMMPNSRINSVMNKDVVEFTVAPVGFVNTNIRTMQLRDGYAQEDLLCVIETAIFGFFIILCVILLCMLLSYLLQKTRKRREKKEEERYNGKTIIRQ